jgi:serine/threonine-protein kinase RsbW
MAKKLQEEHLIADEDTRTMMEVCFNEALKNAISHGNGDDPQRWVSIRLFKDQTEWGLLVKDEGSGFTLDDVPDPDAPDFILREHGRGIFMMRNLVDRVEYFEGGRAVLLTKTFEHVNRPSAQVDAESIPITIATMKKGVVARLVLPNMDDAVVDSVFAQIEEAIEKVDATTVVVDLSETTRSSSHALGRLVTLQVTCLRLGHRLRLSGMSKALLGIFVSARLGSVFSMYTTIDEALNSPATLQKHGIMP